MSSQRSAHTTPQLAHYKPSYVMTDRYFPNAVPSREQVDCTLSTLYMPSTIIKCKGIFTVKVWDTVRKVRNEADDFWVPLYYLKHLHRILWRKMAFGEIYRFWRADKIHLPPDFIPLVMKYIVYTDAMVECFLSPMRKRSTSSNYRSVLFDTYLAVEGSVMRHEYDIVGLWRRDHPEINLECLDASSLGEYGPIHPSTKPAHLIECRLGQHLQQTRQAISTLVWSITWLEYLVCAARGMAEHCK